MKAASRLERAQTLTAAASCRAAGHSERQAAAAIGCPRSNFRSPDLQDFNVTPVRKNGAPTYGRRRGG